MNERHTATPRTLERDAVVIGGGWSGLLAAKYALEAGFSVRVIERREKIGGVWCLTTSKETPSVADYTRTTSSRVLTEASDFPFPDAYGAFPRHDQILEYLNDYVDRFGLRPHIKTGVEVAKTERIEHGWRTHTSTEVIESRYLIVSTGNHGVRNTSGDAMLEGFEGEVVQAMALKTRRALIEAARGRRVLFVGGGETAADMVEVLCDSGEAASVAWSIPNGQRFFRKYASLPGLMPPQVLDEAMAKVFLDLSPYEMGKPGLAMWCRMSTAGTPTAYNGHNVFEWRTASANFRSAFNKNGAVLDRVYDGEVLPKRRPVSISGKRIEFDEGEAGEFDLVITCLGYKSGSMDFLPESHRIEPHRCWRLVFHPRDPSLFFIGYARPLIGSIPFVSELQSKLLMQVLTGSASLPEHLPEAIEAEVQAREAYFEGTSQRLKGLIDPISYLSAVMKEGGFEVDFERLRREDPLAWFFLYFGPLHVSIIHFSDPARRADVLRTYRRYFRREFLSGFFIVLVSRFSGLDAAASWLGELKYRLEESAPELRRSGWLDVPWKLYRRTLFNRTSLWSRRVVPHYVSCAPIRVGGGPSAESRKVQPADTVRVPSEKDP